MNDNTQNLTKDLKHSSGFSYLLRLWRTDAAGSFNWQASLENTETRKRIGFANLEQLFAYLMDLIEGKVNLQNTARKEQMDENGKRE